MDLAMDRLLTAAAAVCALAISGPALAQTRTGGNIASQLNQQELSRLSTAAVPQPIVPQGYPPQGYAPQDYASQGYTPQGYPPQGYTPQGYTLAGLHAAGLHAAGLHAAGLCAGFTLIDRVTRRKPPTRAMGTMPPTRTRPARIIPIIPTPTRRIPTRQPTLITMIPILITMTRLSPLRSPPL